ncbi:unnamed protein product [Caretta caretta]
MLGNLLASSSHKNSAEFPRVGHHVAQLALSISDPAKDLSRQARVGVYWLYQLLLHQRGLTIHEAEALWCWDWHRDSRLLGNRNTARVGEVFGKFFWEGQRRSFLQMAVLAIQDPLLRVSQVGLLLTCSLMGEAQQLIVDKMLCFGSWTLPGSPAPIRSSLAVSYLARHQTLCRELLWARTAEPVVILAGVAPGSITVTHGLPPLTGSEEGLLRDVDAMLKSLLTATPSTDKLPHILEEVEDPCPSTSSSAHSPWDSSSAWDSDRSEANGRRCFVPGTPRDSEEEEEERVDVATEEAALKNIQEQLQGREKELIEELSDNSPRGTVLANSLIAVCNLSTMTPALEPELETHLLQAALHAVFTLGTEKDTTQVQHMNYWIMSRVSQERARATRSSTALLRSTITLLEFDNSAEFPRMGHHVAQLALSISDPAKDLSRQASEGVYQLYQLLLHESG